MANLRKFTLSKDQETNNWKLTNDQTNRVVTRFDSKGDATKGGVLENAIGKDGGSVKIQKQNGRIEEERTYPGSKDPRRSKG